MVHGMLRIVATLIFVLMGCGLCTAEWDTVIIDGSWVNYKLVTPNLILVAPQATINTSQSSCVQHPFSSNYFIPLEVTFWTPSYLQKVAQAVNTEKGTNLSASQALPLQASQFRLRWRDTDFHSSAQKEVLLTQDWVPNTGTGYLPQKFSFLLGSPNKKEQQCSKSHSLLLSHSALYSLIVAEFQMLSPKSFSSRISESRVIREQNLLVGVYQSVNKQLRMPYLIHKAEVTKWATQVIKKHLENRTISQAKEKLIRHGIEKYICPEAASYRIWRKYTNNQPRQIYPPKTKGNMSWGSHEKYCIIRKRFNDGSKIVASYAIESDYRSLFSVPLS